jgi:Fe-Mn family superoxide dismutase
VDNSRRDFLKKTGALVLGSIAASSILNKVFASGAGTGTPALPAEGDKYILEGLPYAYDALEPHIDKMTMEIHHSKHYAGYITNLNKAVESLDASLVGGKKSLQSMFDHMDKLPAAIRNNGGGYYNHFVFWKMMKPNGGGKPSGKLGEEITKTFGSFDEFKKQFTDAAMKRFGSGWTWLVKTKEGKLVITSTANQDNPLMNLDTVEVKGTPVLALDVWEHAYYLKNQNRRADYITSWWNVVNWETAEEMFGGK